MTATKVWPHEGAMIFSGIGSTLMIILNKYFRSEISIFSKLKYVN